MKTFIPTPADVYQNDAGKEESRLLVEQVISALYENWSTKHKLGCEVRHKCNCDLNTALLSELRISFEPRGWSVGMRSAGKGKGFFVMVNPT